MGIKQSLRRQEQALLDKYLAIVLVDDATCHPIQLLIELCYSFSPTVLWIIIPEGNLG